ncbi:MAG: class I SAM-dependent RNA methyltransferase [Elainellaceae cyanobacterium]
MATYRYFATTARGLEPLVAQELQQLGASAIEPGFAGVSFEGDRALLYRVNLWGRIPFRVLLHLSEQGCRDGAQLYGAVQTVDWGNYLTPEQTFSVRATGKNRQLNHSHFTALQVKNAIVDQQRQQFGHRSSIDTQDPDVRINVHIHGDGPSGPAQGQRVTISLDSTGESLHRRGYRPAVGQAPLKETLAAALLQLAEWTPDQPFLDPLCGSGTLPIEAARQALQIAPGLGRDFAFQRWPDFDASLWQQQRQEAEQQRCRSVDIPIVGSDRDGSVIQQAQSNAALAGVADQVTLLVQALSELVPPADHGVIICNPPYGERLGEADQLGPFYKQLGDVLKQRCRGWTAYVLCGNLTLAKRIGLRPSRRIPVFNGSIECRLLRYELY